MLQTRLSVRSQVCPAGWPNSYGVKDGRRPVYLLSLPFLGIGSVGVILSRSVSELMVWRFIQTFGASGGLSLGSGVIGDIYKLDERYALCLFAIPNMTPLCTEERLWVFSSPSVPHISIESCAAL